MQWLQAKEEHCDAVFQLVQHTIQAVYPHYYPEKIVEFFLQHHSKRQMEEIAAENYSVVQLDASLPAGHFYERLGYQTIRHEKMAIGQNFVLVYEVMEKFLNI